MQSIAIFSCVLFIKLKINIFLAFYNYVNNIEFIYYDLKELL